MSKTKKNGGDRNAKFKRKPGGNIRGAEKGKKKRSNHSLNPGLILKIIFKIN
jgi:hypothetical protein